MKAPFLRTLLAACQFCLLGLVARAAESPASASAAAPFSFIQLADTQFGFFNNDLTWEQETANFEFVVAEINRLKPAFVVISGDLINRPGDPRQIAEFKRIAAKIAPPIKLYLAAGNHDVGTDPTPESLELYRKEFGPSFYSFRHNDFAGIILDSDLITSPGRVQAEADAQETWLKAELARLKEAGVRHIAVFQHHPYFWEAADEPDRGGYMNIPLARRTRYLSILKEGGVTHVFAGHLHRNAAGRDGTLSMYSTGPVGRPLGTDPSGLAIVSVGPNVMEYRYVSLGQIPSSLTGRGRGGRGRL